MAASLKKLVSKKKRRFQEDGFDLDMTFITERIVAMGFPAEKMEGVYRNNMKDVKRFFDTKHKDHYKVYNLCEERDYDPQKFYGRVAKFPFADHNAPPFQLMKPFCEDVSNYLAEDPRNVVVIHCKAGKGRTGVMICAYLLHQSPAMATKDALAFYGKQRTTNEKGVTIASQVRYVHYYGRYVRENMHYKSTTLLIKALRFIGIPNFSQGTCIPQFIVRKGSTVVFKSPWKEDISKDQKEALLTLTPPTPVCDDVKIEFVHRKSTSKEKMFHLWFNTFFIDDSMRLVIPKMELDKANKDKKHKLFPSDFCLEIIFEKPSADASDEFGAMGVSDGADAGGRPGLPHQGSMVSQDPEFSDSDLTDDDDDEEEEGNHWEGMPVTDV